MAGVSDPAFRRLVREAGAALAFPEMISDKALLFGNVKTHKLAAPYPGEDPFVVQFLGSDPDTLARAALMALEHFDPRLIDINMGCPVPKVIRNGEGAALLRDPSLCGRIIERVRKALPSDVAVSCKIRLGFDKPCAPEVARIVSEAGAAFVTVHGRLRTQSYSTPADWEAIAATVAAVKTPVVGNGDVLRPADAARLLELTGCEAVMIGRGALGNPWLFERTLRLSRFGDAGPPPSPAVRLQTALRHLRLAVLDKGERSAVLEMRRHGSWYIKGLPGASAVRPQLMMATTAVAMTRVFEDYLTVLTGETGD
jgi:tRNA-dihydrouridine synthase B